MSYHVFFSFSTGLKKPIMCPKGTFAAIMSHIQNVEETLGLKREQYDNNPVHWNYDWLTDDLDNEVVCQIVEMHNRWVRWLYEEIADWAKNPVADGEAITQEDAQKFWHGLRTLNVPTERWTGQYYRFRMEHLYEVMRGRPSEGVSLDAEAMTPDQAGAVIRLFSEYLDPQDLRLEVPKDCDHLASSFYGEYDWCERCGAVLPEYADGCRERACPVQANWCDEDRPIWFRAEDETDEQYEQRCRERAEEQGWREATPGEIAAQFMRFQNERFGSQSDAADWTALWLAEGERY